MLSFQALRYSVGTDNFYLGTVSAKDFVSNYEIDAHGMDNPYGYQRISKLVRSKRFANFVAKYDGFFHQTVLVNIRDPGSIKFAPFNGSNYGTLTVESKLYIV